MSGRGKGKPKGKFHKGGRKHFSSEDELKKQTEEVERRKQWREKHGSDSEEEGDGDKKEKDGSDEGSSSEESESEDEGRAKGVSHLIEIENPNRVAQKSKKVTQISLEDNKQLTRREREEIEKQKAQVHYQKLHAQGKTDEARADLARLALIKKQREDSAKKRDEEKQRKEEVSKAAAAKAPSANR